MMALYILLREIAEKSTDQIVWSCIVVAVLLLWVYAVVKVQN